MNLIDEGIYLGYHYETLRYIDEDTKDEMLQYYIHGIDGCDGGWGDGYTREDFEAGHILQTIHEMIELA